MAVTLKRVAYQAQLDPAFCGEIAATPGAETLRNCIQCGTCSGSCPVSPYMDLTPRQIIGLTRAGFKDQVLNCFTIWLCASCYNCTVECPQSIKVTDVMYALKRRAIHEGVHPRGFPIPVLAREFSRSVLESGRNSETYVAAKLYMKTNPLKHVGKGLFAFKLWLTGRLRIGKERIKNVKELGLIMRSASEG